MLRRGCLVVIIVRVRYNPCDPAPLVGHNDHLIANGLRWIYVGALRRLTVKCVSGDSGISACMACQHLIIRILQPSNSNPLSLFIIKSIRRDGRCDKLLMVAFSLSRGKTLQFLIARRSGVHGAAPSISALVTMPVLLVTGHFPVALEGSRTPVVLAAERHLGRMSIHVRGQQVFVGLLDATYRACELGIVRRMEVLLMLFQITFPLRCSRALVTLERSLCGMYDGMIFETVRSSERFVTLVALEWLVISMPYHMLLQGALVFEPAVTLSTHEREVAIIGMGQSISGVCLCVLVQAADTREASIAVLDLASIRMGKLRIMPFQMCCQTLLDHSPVANGAVVRWIMIVVNIDEMMHHSMIANVEVAVAARMRQGGPPSLSLDGHHTTRQAGVRPGPIRSELLEERLARRLSHVPTACQLLQVCRPRLCDSDTPLLRLVECIERKETEDNDDRRLQKLQEKGMVFGVGVRQPAPAICGNVDV